MHVLRFDVRPAGPPDATEMARLAGELGYPMADEEMRRRLARLLPDAQHCIIVADQGLKLIGWMHVERRFTLEGGDRAELMGLVIDAAARRSGAGRALVAAAERWAVSQGLSLLTVRSNVLRDVSHPFYRALGYALSKTQHVYTKPLT